MKTNLFLSLVLLALLFGGTVTTAQAQSPNPDFLPPNWPHGMSVCELRDGVYLSSWPGSQAYPVSGSLVWTGRVVAPDGQGGLKYRLYFEFVPYKGAATTYNNIVWMPALLFDDLCKSTYPAP